MRAPLRLFLVLIWMESFGRYLFVVSVAAAWLDEIGGEGSVSVIHGARNLSVERRLPKDVNAVTEMRI